MGWDSFPGASKSDVVAILVDQYKPIDHELIDNVLWAVVDDAIFGVLILCLPLAEFLDSGWGYTIVPERVGPLRVSRPLRLLDLAPIASRPWRKRVREFHASVSKPTPVSDA